MIEWLPLPQEPGEELQEDMYLIYLPNSDRAINATHDAMNRHFYYETEDTQYIYPYRYVSHYAEMNWPINQV